MSGPVSSSVTTTATGSRYRGSLAGRVTLLTTLAVAGSIALIAVGLYFVVRIQLQANMDESLLKRAHAAASNPQYIHDARDGTYFPVFALNAGDIALMSINQNGGYWNPQNRAKADFPTPGVPEAYVAQRKIPSTVRTISSVRVRRKGPCVTIEFDGDGFLYKMVRLMVGALVKCAFGKMRIEEIVSQLDSGKLGSARFAAPAKGLYLVRVRY